MAATSIRLYPNSDQRKILKVWFDVCRQYYNHTVYLLNHGCNLSKFELRDFVKNELEKDNPVSKTVPCDIRVGAIFDAFTACKTAKDNTFKKGFLHEVKFRKKKKSQAITLPKTCIRKQTFYTSYLGEMKSSKPFNGAKHECRLCYKNLNYYLQIPNYVEQSVLPDNQGKLGNFVAVDPGVRTFMTAYSEQGIFEFGNSDISRISKLEQHKKSLKGSRKRKARARIAKKIENLVKDVHWKTGKFLTKNFENVYIPSFNVKQMTKKSNKTLTKNTKKAMLNWSHYAFRMRLIHQARKNGANVWVTNESYTSKTCTRCGELNDNLGSKKVFNCTKCHLKIGRDINGARNILLRALVDSPLSTDM